MRYFTKLITIILYSTAVVNAETPMTHWQSSKNIPARAIVTLLHGLNNTPQVMDPLANELNQLGFHTLRLSLSGHRGDSSKANEERWVEDTTQALSGLKYEFPELPIFAIGFSAGASTFIATIERHPEIKPSKIALIAPAIALKGYTNLIKPIMPLAAIGIPAFTLMPKKYRAERFPPLQFYKTLFKIVDLAKEPKQMNSIPTKVFLARDDEFVSFKNTERWIKKFNLPCELIELNPKPEFKESFNHLVIDQPSLGETEWQKLVSEISKFFTAANNSP